MRVIVRVSVGTGQREPASNSPCAKKTWLQFRKHVMLVGVIYAFLVRAASVDATPIYVVAFDDPTNSYTAYYSQITSNLLAAGRNWNRFLGGASVSIDLLVRFDPTEARTGGADATNRVVSSKGGVDIAQEGVPFELRTGVDPNGVSPDAFITFNPMYLQDELWFDPNPLLRTAPVPSNKIDAESVLIHELGHIFGFNGFLDRVNGQVKNNFESTYDQWVTFNGNDLFFTGPAAETIYGGPVPLTSGNYTHLGNASPRPGADLILDLMNGVQYDHGRRYDISALDLAVLADTGVPIVPEPSSLILLGTGTLLFLSLRKAVKYRGGRTNSCN